MNVKFLLFCIASLGSLMMLYMWFTANSTIKDTQSNEEQYVYRISSLKSEIEVEKRLMESLRKDVKIYANNIIEKTSLIDKMNKKGVQFDKEKSKLEKEMEALRLDINKLTNSNEEEKKKLENDYEATLKDENSQIDSLESEIKKLTTEKKDLLEKQSKTVKNVKISDPNDNINNNAMQGKAPKIKESKVDDIPSDTKTLNKVNEPNKNRIMNQNKKESKNDPNKNKITNQNKKESKDDSNKFMTMNQNKKESKNDPNKIMTMNQNKKELKDNAEVKPFVELKKPHDFDIHGNPLVPKIAQNVKPVHSNDVKDSKEEFPVKDNEKPKLNQAKDNSQLFPPDSIANDLNVRKNKDSQPEQMDKKDPHADRQLKPPKNEKDLKDDFIKGGMLLKNNLKKDFEKDI